MSATTDEGAYSRFVTVRHRLFAARHEAAVPTMVALSFGMAALTALAAQLRIPLPFSPVPVTGQTFAVLLSGLVLGRTYGGASQVLYLVVGVAIGVAGLGIPWFADGAAGIGVVLGPTGGYLVGFVLAATLVGWVTDRSVRFRGFPYLHLTLVAANLLIYVPGLVGLAWFFHATGAAPATPSNVIALGVAPFVVGDAVKLAAAAVVGTLVAPKESFGPETDRVDAPSSSLGSP